MFVGMTERKPKNGGWINLLNHIQTKRPNYLNENKESHESLKGYAFNPEVKKIFGWIELILINGFPFSCIESVYYSKYTTLQTTSRPTLFKLLTKDIETNTSKNQLDCFGLMFYGWMDRLFYFHAIRRSGDTYDQNGKCLNQGKCVC